MKNWGLILQKEYGIIFTSPSNQVRRGFLFSAISLTNKINLLANRATSECINCGPRRDLMVTHTGVAFFVALARNEETMYRKIEYKYKDLPPELKECSKCHKALPRSEFYKNKKAKDGLTYACGVCLYKPNGGKFGRPAPNVIKGQVYGNLTAIKRNGKDKWNKVLWLCKCECGNCKNILGTNLVKGKTVSCGCVNEKQSTPNKDKNFRIALKNYKQGARRRNYSWGLTPKQALSLFRSYCFYCNAPPSNTIKSDGVEDFVYNGIDRLDPSIGYIPENCVPCCAKCNYIKGTMTLEEFESHIIVLHNNLIKRKGGQ